MALFQTLMDNFDGTVLNTAKWGSFGTGITLTGQTLQYVQPATSATYRGIDSFVSYDLTGSYVYMQVKNAGNQSLASLEVYPVQVIKDASNSVKWLIAGNTIYALKTIAGVQTTQFSTAYVAATHQWFRIRESGGTVFWDTSADGWTWTNRASIAVASLWAVTVVTNESSIGTWASEATGTTVIFDNFNYPPASGNFFRIL